MNKTGDVPLTGTSPVLLQGRSGLSRSSEKSPSSVGDFGRWGF